MIIIPELKIVLVQPPRTGSTSLREAIMAKYPKAMNIYRHMERSGVPMGYENWRVVCQMRPALPRLRSLYRYMKNPISTGNGINAEWKAAVQADTDRPFSEWLTDGVHPFALQGDRNSPHFNPFYGTDVGANLELPIARRSVWFWARPDLGPVDLLWTGDIERADELLGVRPRVSNKSHRGQGDVEPFENYEAHQRIGRHLETYFAWDAEQVRIR